MFAIAFDENMCCRKNNEHFCFYSKQTSRNVARAKNEHFCKKRAEKTWYAKKGPKWQSRNERKQMPRTLSKGYLYMWKGGYGTWNPLHCQTLPSSLPVSEPRLAVLMDGLVHASGTLTHAKVLRHIGLGGDQFSSRAPQNQPLRQAEHPWDACQDISDTVS